MTCLGCRDYQAVVYCIECNSLQCIACEKQSHQTSINQQHERLSLDAIDGQCCAFHRQHPAVFYCSACPLSFCFPCYENHHLHSDGKEHKPQKHRQGQTPIITRSRIESQTAPSSVYPDLSSAPNEKINTSMPVFEEIQLNNEHSNHSLSSIRDEPTLPSEMSAHDTTPTKQGPPETNLDAALFLLNAKEQLTVNTEAEFIHKLGSSPTKPPHPVKCVSIIGNTGDGKSFTLNQLFFNGQNKFNTSSTADSCTMGVWAALAENQRTLVLDTEGRLGLSQNDNIRNRLLLKILCISDIVIFRTRAPKLPNDMFQFLSDASNAFLKYFRKELENVMKSCKVDGPMSTMGPTLVVFHETQHTEVLRDQIQSERTAVEQLKERFEKMNLSYDAYSSIEYVGIQTLGGKATDFSEIKATITAILENNKIRSPRSLSVIFRSLKALNKKFNHAIPPEMPSTLPDDFFACCMKCLSCGSKCILPAKHQKENASHQCNESCTYRKDLNNEVWKCLQCQREGRDLIVYGKKLPKDDNLVQGFLKYVWSGFVVECPHHGEIFRSRKHWYGNTEAKDVTRAEVIHVWPGDDRNRFGSDVSARRMVEGIHELGCNVFSRPTKLLLEKAADQLAPTYWVPNNVGEDCSECKLQLTKFTKHHCRACGNIFCDTCSTYRTIVPMLETKTPERVCGNCYQKLQSQTLSSVFKNHHAYPEQTHVNEDQANSNDGTTSEISTHSNPRNIPMSRRALEVFRNNVSPLVYDYPLKLIKESTRPDYWRPDSDCHDCFVCKHPFDTTKRQLHHCRKCGEGVCDMCSPNRRPVPERDWHTPKRVCTLCDQSMSEINSESR